MNWPIPKVFHRIFLDDPIPEKFEQFWVRLKKLHPDWRFVTWNNSHELEWIVNRPAFERATTHAGRSDVLRYEIMARYGGVYLDTDVEPLKPFGPLVEPGIPFAGWEDSNLLCPTVIGSPPEHPAARVLVEQLESWSYRYRQSPPNRQTGPYFFSQMWRFRNDVTLHPPVVFYPVGWWEKDKLGGPYPPESYSVHHWAAQWLPNGPPQKVRK